MNSSKYSHGLLLEQQKTKRIFCLQKPSKQKQKLKTETSDLIPVCAKRAESLKSFKEKIKTWTTDTSACRVGKHIWKYYEITLVRPRPVAFAIIFDCAMLITGSIIYLVKTKIKNSSVSALVTRWGFFFGWCDWAMWSTIFTYITASEHFTLVFLY